MKPEVLTASQPLRRIALMLLASSLMAAAAPQAGGGRKSLEINVSDDRQAARVTVPEGVATVVLQVFRREGGWSRVAVKQAAPGVMRFKIPAALTGKRFRAIGKFETATVSHDKFPASFYHGKNRFNATKSGNAGSLKPQRLDEGNLIAGDSPVEADIWKVDGATVYFFNQLRGLQVLDLTNPADPRMTASLRMPAVGQDLYLLPGSGSDRSLVLLTQGWSQAGGEWTDIQVVKVSSGNASITSTSRVPGYLADSRMIGSRLVLATTEWKAPANDANGEWTATTHLSEWRISADAAPKQTGDRLIDGDSPVISAGPDWLALAVHPGNDWSVSEVSVFALRASGLTRMAPPIRTEGSVEDKSAMQWSDNVLTTISEKNTRANVWSPVTVLENFRAWSPDVVHIQLVEGRLGRLTLAKGESLFASRFAGNKAYIVTYHQSDPLFVVDLADPNKPEIAGQIEVPGWSTHLEPLGDLLFAIGWEDDAPVASLFDVANPAAPSMQRRVALGAAGSYSEALWDDKALKVLPDAGLAMVPLTTYDRKSGETSSVVRLVDVDIVARDIRLRGTIPHEFDARRADLTGNSVVSISDRVMVAADIADRNAPAVISEVALAWPVDRVLEAGDHLLQIENGSWYGGGRATARVSPAGATEQILSETDLGNGTVKSADLRDGVLVVLRESSPEPVFYRQARIIGGETGSNNRLTLDTYDASALPALVRLGSCSVRVPDGGHVAVDHLLWPRENRPTAVVDFAWSFGWGPVFKGAAASTFSEATAPVGKMAAISTAFFPNGFSEESPRIVVFDVADPRTPLAGEPVVLGADGTDFTGVAEASDGLVVVGNARRKAGADGKFLAPGAAYQTARVVAVESTGSPIVRPAVDLPGELCAVTELDRDGFLAFTRSDANVDNVTIQVSACDGYDAFSITGIDAPADAAVTAGGRRLFVATRDGIERHLLTDDGNFTDEATLATGWRADSLRWVNGTLLGARWNAVFAADDADGVVTRWKFQTWNPGVDQAVPTGSGDLLIPFGDYGVERLVR